MKTIECACGHMCGNSVEVEDDFEYKYCCSGFGCSCNSATTNPRFCQKCIDHHNLRKDINERT